MKKKIIGGLMLGAVGLGVFLVLAICVGGDMALVICLSALFLYWFIVKAVELITKD